MIKSVFKVIIIGMLIFLVFYLMGSFYSTTFNIAKWTEDTRAAIAITGGIFAVFGMLITISYEATL